MNVQYSIDPYSLPDQGGDQGILQDPYGAEQDPYYGNGNIQPEGGILPDDYQQGGMIYNDGQQMDPGVMVPPSAQMPESPYLGQLIFEKQSLDPSMCPQASALLDIEIERLRNESNPREHRFPEPMMANPYEHKIRLMQKIAMPLNMYPNLNFGGNIIGKSGENILKLKEETKCKIMIFGRGSINNREKESSLLNSGDPKYAHLCQDLHVHLETFAFPQQAYENMAKAVAAITKCFNDLIEQSGFSPMTQGGGPMRRGGGMGGGGRGGGRGGGGDRMMGGASQFGGGNSFRGGHRGGRDSNGGGGDRDRNGGGGFGGHRGGGMGGRGGGGMGRGGQRGGGGFDGGQRGGGGMRGGGGDRRGGGGQQRDFGGRGGSRGGGSGGSSARYTPY